MTSPLILIKIFETLESIFICLFPIALVTSITLTGILIYSGAFVFALLFILKQKKEFEHIKTLPWHVSAFFIYIFAFTLTKLVNTGLESAFHAFFRTCQDYFVFLWVTFYVSGKIKNQEKLKYFLIIAGLISIVYGIFQFFNLDYFQRQAVEGRMSGFHKNPYSFSGQLIIFFFLFLNQMLNTNGTVSRVPTIILAATCMFCILNASERAVIFGVLIAIIVYLVLYRGAINHASTALIATILFIPLLLTYFLNNKVIKRIKNVFFKSKTTKKNPRIKLWGIALSIWKRNILFGYGKFPAVYHEANNFLAMKVLTHAHNVYLQILVTNGIIGLLAYLNIFFSLLKFLFINLKKNSLAICLIAVIVAYFIEGFFEYFWGDSEVRYLLLYFMGFVYGTLLDFNLKESKIN